MVLTKEQKKFYDEMKSGSRQRRAALKDAWLWPNGNIPYELDPTLGTEQPSKLCSNGGGSEVSTERV